MAKKVVLSQGMWDAHTNIQMLRYMAKHTTNVNWNQFREIYWSVKENLYCLKADKKLSRTAYKYFLRQCWSIKGALLCMYKANNRDEVFGNWERRRAF